MYSLKKRLQFVQVPITFVKISAVQQSQPAVCSFTEIWHLCVRERLYCQCCIKTVHPCLDNKYISLTARKSLKKAYRTSCGCLWLWSKTGSVHSFFSSHSISLINLPPGDQQIDEEDASLSEKLIKWEGKARGENVRRKKAGSSTRRTGHAHMAWILYLS